ncbi:hypothetical protein VTN00DRAFT_838 [Thermoascus crustaceus]|uniref:uncharacterized protein n=1 Tax=Thermoascus crustaceus TaxID=5088 RepID=UPI0037428836
MPPSFPRQPLQLHCVATVACTFDAPLPSSAHPTRDHAIGHRPRQNGAHWPPLDIDGLGRVVWDGWMFVLCRSTAKAKGSYIRPHHVRDGGGKGKGKFVSFQHLQPREHPHAPHTQVTGTQAAPPTRGLLVGDLGIRDSPSLGSASVRPRRVATHVGRDLPKCLTRGHDIHVTSAWYDMVFFWTWPSPRLHREHQGSRIHIRDPDPE